MNVNTYMQGVTPRSLKASLDSQLIPKPNPPAHTMDLPSAGQLPTTFTASEARNGGLSRKTKASSLPTVRDVAEYVLHKCGAMSAMKLQKLVYYAQAWSLVWDDAPLFTERIEAWANGPVSPALYQAHRGAFHVEPGMLGGRASVLTPTQAETVNAVLNFYGDKSPQWLSDLTHFEAPWREARQGLDPGERGNAAISHAAMVEYYGSLQ
jgi:uncharacterized phage-associated protein